MTIRKRQGEKPEKIKQGRLDEPLLLITLLLVAIGLVMVFSGSYAEAYKEGNSMKYVIKQGLFAIGGIAAMLFVSKWDYKKLHYLAIPVMAVATILMVAVRFVGTAEGGARRWINIVGISFQPSEIMKFAIILFFASMMSLMGKKKMKTFTSGFLFYMMVLGMTAGLLVLQKHLSAIAIICFVGGVMMFVGGTRILYLAGLAGIGAAGAVAYASASEYVIPRLKVWIDPFIDFSNIGWQGAQSFMAIGSGGLWGLGLGQSRQKHLFLPEPYNDFIFSVVCEELGFIGAFLILLVFAAFIIRGYYIAMHAPDKFATLLAVGITTQIGFQTIFNICVCCGLLPVTGVSLPFFSYGGTALLMLLGEVGILLSISRYIKAKKNE